MTDQAEWNEVHPLRSKDDEGHVIFAPDQRPIFFNNTHTHFDLHVEFWAEAAGTFGATKIGNAGGGTNNILDQGRSQGVVLVVAGNMCEVRATTGCVRWRILGMRRWIRVPSHHVHDEAHPLGVGD